MTKLTNKQMVYIAGELVTKCLDEAQLHRAAFMWTLASLEAHPDIALGIYEDLQKRTPAEDVYKKHEEKMKTILRVIEGGKVDELRKTTGSAD